MSFSLGAQIFYIHDHGSETMNVIQPQKYLNKLQIHRIKKKEHCEETERERKFIVL